MNSWTDKVGYCMSIAAIVCMLVGLGMIIIKWQNKSDWCYANGGKMLETSKGWVCAKVEVLK
jgi:hypothetical protein